MVSSATSPLRRFSGLSARGCKVLAVDSTASDGPYLTPLGPDGRPLGLGRGVALLTSRSPRASELLRAYNAGAPASVTFEVRDDDGTVQRFAVHDVPLHHLLEESFADDPERWPEPDALHYAAGGTAA